MRWPEQRALTTLATSPPDFQKLVRDHRPPEYADVEGADTWNR